MKRLTNNTDASMRATLNSFSLTLKSIALCLTMMFFMVSKGQTVFNDPVKITALGAGMSTIPYADQFGTVGVSNLQFLNTLNENIVLYQPAPTTPLGNYMSFRTNAVATNGGKIGQAPNSTVFEIRQEENANMDFFTNGTRRMRVHTSGGNTWVGIGMTAPSGTNGMFVSNTVTGWNAITFPGTAATPGLSVNNDIETNGSMFSNNYYLYSDERIKINLNPLADWRKVLDINTYSYNYKDKTNKKTGLSYGFKAQEVYKVLPELTALNGGILGVDYISFIPFLTEGIKDHDQQLKKMELLLSNQPKIEDEKISLLEAENKLLKERLDRLEAMLNAIPNNPKIEGGAIEKNKGQIGVLKDKAVLEQNEPNPFTEKTEIRYFLPEGTANARISVKTNEGKIVGDFPLNILGFGSISINPGTLAAGSYYYSLTSNGLVIDTKKMTLIK